MKITRSARQLHACVAGVAFLFYIVAGLGETSLFERAVGGGSPISKLASALQHTVLLRSTVLLTLATVLSAFVLAVSLFIITRTFGLGLALLGLTARVAEGVIGALYTLPTLGILSVARALKGELAPGEAEVLVAVLLDLRHHTMLVSAFCFAAGSTAFSYLLLRGRAVPTGLAWLGVAASVLLLLALPVQIAVDARGFLTMLAWLPMLLFELVLAGWLIVRGVAPLDPSNPSKG